jgi:hypothetical protein
MKLIETEKMLDSSINFLSNRLKVPHEVSIDLKTSKASKWICAASKWIKVQKYFLLLYGLYKIFEFYYCYEFEM